MDRADWLVAGAAIVGILGIRFGIWWADATAAILISLEVLRDGYTHLKLATFDMLDHCPRTIDGKASDPVIARLAQALHELDWVRESEVRLRTSGRTFSGEAFVVPVSDEYLTERVEQAMRNLRKVDWRLHHLTLTPVASLSTLAEEDGPSRSHPSRDRPEQHKGGNQHQGSRVHHIIPELSGEAGRDRA
jgi:Co/Zn/Cd efflux system component